MLIDQLTVDALLESAKDWLALLCGSEQVANEKIRRIYNGELQLLVIEPIYGARVLILAEAIALTRGA